MKKLSILVYGDIGGSGGYIRYCKGLFGSNAIPSDIDVTFICSKALYDNLKPLDNSIKIIIAPWMASKYRYQRYLWHLWIYPQLVRSINPDIEFFPSGVRRVYMRNATTVTTCHNLLLFDHKELDKVEDRKELKYFISAGKKQKASFKKSNGVIFLSEHSSNVVRAQIPDIKLSTVIAHGLDAPFFSSDDRSYKIGKSISVLYVSPIYRYKRQSEVVRAISHARAQTGLDISIKLVGGGSESERIKLRNTIASENAESFVHLVGALPYKKLLTEYKASDLFIFASTCETFGITLLEAMGAKLPIACSNRTGLESILKDAGTYFDPDDSHSIKNAILSLLESEEIRAELGRKAFHLAQHYKWERCATKTFAFIKHVHENTL